MTTNLLRDNLIAYMQSASPDASITVSESTDNDKIPLPTLSVGIASAEPHSAALAHVMRCQVEIVLRVHSGDREETGPWQTVIEQALIDPGIVKPSLTNGIRVDYWRYEGATPEWDDSIREVTFSAMCLVVGI